MGACCHNLRHHPSATAMTQGALASSTSPPPQQRLEGLRYHRPCLCRSNGSRVFGIIDLVSAAATAWGAPVSSTLHSPQQWLEGLRYHRPHLRRSNDSSGFEIVNPTSAAAPSRGAPASSTLPPPQQRLEKLRHHLRHHRLFHHELDIIINSFNHVPSFPHKHLPKGAGGRSGGPILTRR
jgi:hypothetical protein